jgi:hypothetical protein
VKRFIHNLLRSTAVGIALVWQTLSYLNASTLSISYATFFIPQHTVLAQTVVQSSTPSSTVIVVVTPQVPTSSPLYGVTVYDQQILTEAKVLLAASGTRSYWMLAPYWYGEKVPSSTIPNVISHLMTCENPDRVVNPNSTPKILDSNGYYSYGTLMFQWATWTKWSKASGIKGDPRNAHDAITMATWAIGAGYLDQWSCASILGIVEK